MTLAFDHFVHFTSNPEAALLKFKELGLHAEQGGRHENLGTYNVLSYYGLSYIEFIGIFDHSLVQTSTNVKHSLPASFVKNNFMEGPLRIALRTQDIQGDAERFSKLGLEVVGPIILTRTQPDGQILSWKLLFIGEENQSFELPFLIQWDETDEERMNGLVQKGFIGKHSYEDVKIDSIGYVVKNAEEQAKLWSDFFQLKSENVSIDEQLGAKGIKLVVPGGDIIFYEPTGPGIVEDTLNRKGEGLFTLQFKGASAQDITLFNTLYRF